MKVNHNLQFTKSLVNHLEMVPWKIFQDLTLHRWETIWVERWNTSKSYYNVLANGAIQPTYAHGVVGSVKFEIVVEVCGGG
jgi:hypothetical protein